jgi:hypothetical protein
MCEASTAMMLPPEIREKNFNKEQELPHFTIYSATYRTAHQRTPFLAASQSISSYLVLGELVPTRQVNSVVD